MNEAHFAFNVSVIIVYISISNKEYNNIGLKNQMRKKKSNNMKQEKTTHSLFLCVTHKKEKNEILTLKHTILLFFCRSFVLKMCTSSDNILLNLECHPF